MLTPEPIPLNQTMDLIVSQILQEQAKASSNESKVQVIELMYPILITHGMAGRRLKADWEFDTVTFQRMLVTPKGGTPLTVFATEGKDPLPKIEEGLQGVLDSQLDSFYVYRKVSEDGSHLTLSFLHFPRAGLEEGEVVAVPALRDRLNLLPAVQTQQASVGVIAGPEDERGWAYGEALLKRSRTAIQGIVPVVFLVENEAEAEILQSLGASPEIIYRIGSAEYPTREVALREATNYLRGGLDVAQIIRLGVSEEISPQVEQVLLNLFGIRLDAQAVVQWKEVIDAVVYTFQQA